MRESGHVPEVSVVIPTCRRPALLLRCLFAVLGQHRDPEAVEIIVVDDGHDDLTRDTVETALAGRREGEQWRYLRPARGCGPAVARNCGWRAARAPLIAFTDDDTVPAPDWLREGERALQPPAAAVGGQVKVPWRGTPTDHALMTQGLESAEFVTANAFVRREALERIGGFDERFQRAWREDTDLQFRLQQHAGPVLRCPAAVVVHPVRPERWGVSLRQQRNAYFDALLYKKHPARYREHVRPGPPWLYYAIVALTLPALLFAASVPAIALGCGVVIAALVSAFAWRRLRHTSHEPAHVAEMLVTSALIPYLSVYWRIRGAIAWRVVFL